MKPKVLLVGGVFDDAGGRSSGYTAKLFAGLRLAFGSERVEEINGGTFDSLFSLVESGLADVGALFWFADVPNDKPKLVKRIKEKNSRLMLVISKNNREGRYDRLALVARALSAKANLLCEYTQGEAGIAATVLDPLGNTFVEREEDISKVAKALAERVQQLASFTRVGSRQVGEAIACPEEEEFFSLTRKYAERFHELIHAVNQGRLLGNASFRCENGFPSYRQEGLVFVSQRNIDKRDISTQGFVAVDAGSLGEVAYFGEKKPSVDTPIQLRLYEHYPQVRYMLHAHVYIEGAPFTHSIVPCGAVEEFDEIVALYPDPASTNFYVNLRGHGSLVLAQSAEFLKDIPYIARGV